MKNYTFFILLLLFGSKAFAQDTIPNPGFERWINYGTYSNPDQWSTANSLVSFLGTSALTTLQDSAIVHSGRYSTRLAPTFALGNSIAGVLCNGRLDSTTQSFGHGQPCQSNPTQLNGWYRCSLANSSDSVLLSITLFKAGNQIGYGAINTTTSINNWTSFSIPVSMSVSGVTADSVLLLFSCTGATGSALWLDDLSYLPGINLGGDQTVCSNSNVVLDAGLSGLAIPCTYYWLATGSQLSCNNCANPAVTITQNSTYMVAVTDANGHVYTDTINYTVNGNTNNMQLAFTNTGLSCTSALDTTVLTVTNGTGPYTVNWGNGITEAGHASPAIYPYAAAGDYVIAITDASGCVATGYDTVVNSGVIVAITNATKPNCPYDNTGSVSVGVSGGKAPYTWRWSNASTTQNITGLSYGNYDVTVTDSTGCTASASYYLNSVSDPWGYYAYLQQTGANCGNTGGAVASVYGGIPPYRYLWSNNDTTAAISALAYGSYNLTVTDSAGCQLTATTFVNSSCNSGINGIAFVDNNNNCTRDSGEAALSGISVMATAFNGDNYYGYTDFTGAYNIQVNDTGTFILSAPEWGSGTCGNYVFCNNSPQTVFVAVLGDTLQNNNIAFTSATGFNLGIHPGWTGSNPGFTKQYWIYYYNSAPTPFNGSALITFVYDSNLVYQYSDNPQPVLNATAHTLTWSVTGLDSAGFIAYWSRLDAYFQVPSTLSLNTLLQSDFRIDPTTGDCDSSDNYYHFTETVTGSHDPNEKDVVPANNISSEDSVLTYTIHFQNDGTDSTHFIIVKDTLSTNLDAASVRTIASSAKVSNFTITGKGILTWTFNPYRLPDSLTNPSTSKGFITFTVNKKKNLPLGSVISNTASIYFDYNTPVVTNTVVDTVALPNGIISVPNAGNAITVRAFPNPFKDATNIIVTGLNRKYDFELYDVTGRLLRRIPSININQFQLQQDNMAAGMCLYRLVVNGSQVANGKLVVE